MTRYHSAIGFPPEFVRPVGVISVIATDHARARAESKGIALPEKINLSTVGLFEIEMVGRVLKGIVVRMHFNDKKDLCLAIAINRRARVIKTAWLNDKADAHKTLDPTKYGRP